MTNLEVTKDRFMRDALPNRLGGLAANLARIRSASRHEANHDVVAGLLEESQYFIEWAAPEADVDTQATLVELQVQLARWRRQWDNLCSDPERRQQLAEAAMAWSNRVLELSGLAA